jgi:hypothetical protein
MESQSQRVYLDADSKSKAYGIRLRQLRTGFLEVDPVRGYHHYVSQDRVVKHSAFGKQKTDQPAE